MARVVQLRNIKRALKLDPSDNVNYLISGRISNFRAYKSVNFIDLIDGSTSEHLQVVAHKDLLKKPQLGSYLTCLGNITGSRGSQQRIEFKANSVEFVSQCDPDRWPLASTKGSKLSDGWFRQHLHLRPQASHFASLLRIRSELELSLHMIFKQMDFFKVHTPILSSNDSEASSDLFKVLRHKQFKQQARPQSGEENGFGSDDERRQQQQPLSAGASTLESCNSRETSPMATTTTTTNSPSTQPASSRSDYFDKDVFLATSAQLHLEALASSLSRVYSLGPTFRAENSLSRRHLCEFTMLEAEEANVTSLEPLMDRVEAVLKFAAQFISDVSEFSCDFHALADKYSNHELHAKLAHQRYIRMTYAEAMKVLQELHSQPSASSLLSDLPLSECHYGCDLSRRHERHLLGHCNNVPIFITNYPRQLKPFYMKCHPESGGEVQCFDLIAPFGGEICGGSLREHEPATLRQQLSSQFHDNNHRILSPSAHNHQLKMATNNNNINNNNNNNEASEQQRRQESAIGNFQWYLDLRDFGTFPHGGFGIGFERLIQSLLGIRNIRDTIAFPRSPGSCPM